MINMVIDISFVDKRNIVSRLSSTFCQIPGFMRRLLLFVYQNFTDIILNRGIGTCYLEVVMFK